MKDECSHALDARGSFSGRNSENPLREVGVSGLYAKDLSGEKEVSWNTS